MRVSQAARETRPTSAAAVVFLATALLYHLAYRQFPVLYDADAYYHLAVARLYATHGIVDRLDWARFSVLHDGFGDKELLFHLLLVPFVRLGDPTTGGFLALTILDALVAAVLGAAAVRAIGAWGAVVPFLVVGTATDFTLRTVRLRPELLALLLLLAAVPLAARRRHLVLGALAAVFALSYTAFHALLGLCLLFWTYGWWVERRNDWKLVAYPAAGIALGLLVHPHFPANLRVWFVQNVSFPVHAGALDVGAEIQARTARDLLVLNLGWLVGLVVLWRSRSLDSRDLPDDRLRDLTLVAAAVFALLYLLAARFVLYAVPFVSVAVVRAMQAPGPTVRLPWRGGVPLALALAACLAAAIPATRYAYGRLAASSRLFVPGMRADWEAFAAAMPAGGRVFAPWSATEHLLFWAPGAQYVNVLDPIFLYARDPALHGLMREVLEGREPDVPLVVRSRFDSDLVADDGQYPQMRDRLRADPRVTLLHDGVTYLYRIDDESNRGFLRDWKVVPPTAPFPPPAALLADPATPSWPAAAEPGVHAVEGYVDGRRLGVTSGCLAFARREELVVPRRRQIEIAPYGPAEVFVDDALVAVVPFRGATLGRGVVLSVDMGPGAHRMAVRTCAANGHLGFYALVRSES